MRNRAASFVSRMPFMGIRRVRPAALKGAQAARRGDRAMLNYCKGEIAYVSSINFKFAALGAAVLAANTYAALEAESAVTTAAHATEAAIGAAILAGHSVSGYAQRVINNRLEAIAAPDVPSETAQAYEYPEFPTPYPRGSRLIAEMAAWGTVVGVIHPFTQLVDHVSGR